MRERERGKVLTGMPLHFFFGLFFHTFSPSTLCSLSLLVGADLLGAVVSERFLNVRNPSISLCPGKKYIRMKLKRPSGAKMGEQDKVLSNNLREKKKSEILLEKKRKLKLIWFLFFFFNE